MADPQLDPNDESAGARIISPFAQTTSTVRKSPGGGGSGVALWVVSSLLVLVVVGIAAYFVYKYLDDPYRTLEPFSMDKYMNDYHSMTGNRYKADLKVSNDLGWSPQTGRIMLFTLNNDSRPLPVLIPPKLSGLYFTKGQNYQASLEVQEGGLVYADTCEKE